MLFSTVLVAASLAASATANTLALTCYNATECMTCETTASLNSAAQAFCNGDNWKGNEFLPWGNAQITLEGSLQSQQACLEGISAIVQLCYGFRDGGIYTYPYNNARLDVDFCSCE